MTVWRMSLHEQCRVSYSMALSCDARIASVLSFISALGVIEAEGSIAPADIHHLDLWQLELRNACEILRIIVHTMLDR